MNEIISIQIDNEVIKLTGEALDVFLADRIKMQAEADAIKAEIDAKAVARVSAISKLQKLGLTEQEAKIIIGLE